MPLTCGLEDISAYYFFSTCGQAIAATTSLSGAMLIFRYQSLYQLVADGAQGVAHEFRKAAITKYVPWEGEDHKSFTHHTTFIGKTNVLRRYFGEERASLRRNQFLAKLEAEKVDPKIHLAHYDTLRHLFRQYEARVRAARRLRRLTILTTVVGLFLVLTGAMLVLTPNMHESFPPICSFWYGYVGLLVCYLAFTVYVTAVAFTNPMRER